MASSDLYSAVISQLRASPTLISTIGENTSVRGSTKIWMDFAEGKPSAPWIVIVELGESTEFMSADYRGTINYLCDGRFQVSCYATGRRQARSIASQVVSSLNDADLTFNDGLLMELRHSSFSAQVEHEVAPGFQAIYHQIVEFHYKVQRNL